MSRILSTGGVHLPGRHPLGRYPQQTPPKQTHTPPGRHPLWDSQCSRWYVSYWNAFSWKYQFLAITSLFNGMFTLPNSNSDFLSNPVICRTWHIAQIPIPMLIMCTFLHVLNKALLCVCGYKIIIIRNLSNYSMLVQALVVGVRAVVAHDAWQR